MKERLPTIDKLWQSGAVGENNKGFLEARGVLSATDKATVQAENNDRQVVYQSIASSTKSSASKVGAQRAAQIAKRAKPGLWIQDSSGKWIKK